MKNLLVAVDFSKTTDAVVEQSAKLAKAIQDSKLWVVHVASDESPVMIYETSQFTGYAPELSSMPGDVQLARDLSAEEIKREHRELLNISTGLRAQGINAQAMLLKGDASKLIAQKATELEAEIIILGSHGHGLLHKALLGSISESVMRQADCNVMIVPAVKN
ncbi:MAG: universal stress protein [Pontiella sp.]|nr:universal stress protein [Pontiella sp.]